VRDLGWAPYATPDIFKSKRETIHAVDLMGDGGIKAQTGVVTEIDRGSTCVAIITADGAKEPTGE
jgi:hypothetical protein